MFLWTERIRTIQSDIPTNSAILRTDKRTVIFIFIWCEIRTRSTYMTTKNIN